MAHYVCECLRKVTKENVLQGICIIELDKTTQHNMIPTRGNSKGNGITFDLMIVYIV